VWEQSRPVEASGRSDLAHGTTSAVDTLRGRATPGPPEGCSARVIIAPVHHGLKRRGPASGSATLMPVQARRKGRDIVLTLERFNNSDSVEKRAAGKPAHEPTREIRRL